MPGTLVGRGDDKDEEGVLLITALGVGIGSEVVAAAAVGSVPRATELPEPDGSAGADERVLGGKGADAEFLGSVQAPSRSKRRSLFSTTGLAVQERWP